MLKRILFFLGHPAHFHLFRHSVLELEKMGHQVDVVIKTKDILSDLLDTAGLPYVNLLPGGRADGTLGIIVGVMKKNRALYRYCKQRRPDIMAGTSAEIAHVGKILGIPSLVFSEDDYSVIRQFGRATYPFTDVILSPQSCNNGRWNRKTVHYHGYHKLAYLHPHRFTPDRTVVERYLNAEEPFFMLRLAKLSAHHDAGINGLDDSITEKIVARLSREGRVLVSSERSLPESLEPFRLQINPLDIHHLMAHSRLFISDSQSMTVEAAMLGVPSVRYSDFSGRIGVLEELEKKYELTRSVRTGQTQQFFRIIEDYLADAQIHQISQERKKKMLGEKIDVTAFISWFINEYPESRMIMDNQPDYDLRFLIPAEEAMK